MAIGFGVLALSPAVFWSLTLKELEAAMRGRLGHAPVAGVPTRQEFAALLAAYPDEGCETL